MATLLTKISDMHTLSAIKNQYKIKQVLLITGAWLLVGVVDALFMHLVSNNEYVQRTGDYQFIPILLAYSIGWAVSGLSVGYLSVFHLKDRLRDQSFAYYLLTNVSLILTVGLITNFIGSNVYFLLTLKKPLFHPDVWQSAVKLFTNPLNFKNIIMGFLMLFATMVMIRVNDKYGPGIFFNLLTGKYHQPSVEERIFMFLYMKSSTTIAEQIGHTQFHKLLGDVFRDITDAILYNRGEIYQYVGDEVVISWKVAHGLKNVKCIQCFYDMETFMERKKGQYEERYGLFPTFKAGLHLGNVTVGEIGVIKKDIVFSGDVLNSAARIQSKCNELGANLLISEKLHKRLQLPPNITAHPAGDFHLRGKSVKMKLYALSKK